MLGRGAHSVFENEIESLLRESVPRFMGEQGIPAGSGHRLVNSFSIVGGEAPVCIERSLDEPGRIRSNEARQRNSAQFSL